MNFSKFIKYTLYKFIVLALPIFGIYGGVGNTLPLLIFLAAIGIYVVTYGEIDSLKNLWASISTYIIGSFFLMFFPILWETGEGHPPSLPLIFFLPLYVIICFVPVILCLAINKNKLAKT